MHVKLFIGRGVALAACVSALGCGGGTTAAPPPKAAPLAVASSTPIATTNLDTGAAASISFNNEIDPSTVSPTSFALTGPLGAVLANLVSTGATVTLTPQAPLVWGTRYSMSTTNALKDKLGQSLSTQFSFNFSTAEPSWSMPRTLVSNMTGGPSVAFDGRDNAFAAWQQFSQESNSFNIFAVRFDGASLAWAAPVQINRSVADQSASSPLLAADSQGNAVAVWNQSDARYRIRSYASRFDRAIGNWSNPIVVREGSDTPFPWALKMDPLGNAFVIGYEYSGGGQIFVRRLSSATGLWSDATVLRLGANSAQEPKIDVDSKGNAVAVWLEANDGFKYSVNAARYDVVADKWSAVQSIQKGPGPASNPDVAMDPMGNATAVWVEDPLSGLYVTTVARFDATTGKWGNPQPIPMDKGSANIAKVVMDAAGNATVMWVHSHGFQLFSLNAVRYEATSGALGPVQTIDSVSLTPYSPYVMGSNMGVDPAGNIVAVWQRAAAPSGLTNTFSSRYSATSGVWSAVKPLQGGDIKANQFSVATDRTGSALALWCEDPNGSNNFRLMEARLSGKL